MESSNSLQVFSYYDHLVRTIIGHDGEPWFVAKDVCSVLEHSNYRMAVQELDDDEKGVRNVYTPGGMQAMTVISEPGLYALILKSRKKEAKQFSRWVRHDMLPSIRKTGGYFPLETDRKIRALLDERSALRAEIDTLKKFIQDNSSFTLLGQAITPVKGTLSVGEAAKIFAQHGIKIGQNRLFKLLRDLNLITKRKGRQWNQPTQKSIEQGLCVIVVPLGSKGTPYLTLKGLQKVSDVLAKEQFPLLALLPGDVALHE